MTQQELPMKAMLAVILCALFLAAGCAPLLIAGGAVGGYAIAKDMEDGRLIDSKQTKK
ncbi:MAG: hypothetical protein HY593_04225 [Candidatus Omnitrophica bacterium]|nr:hypothetical protein [Candidatus Omnitrophota bacterium]